MKRRKIFSAGVFAEMARTNRNTLHFYDRKGLLPSVRGKNKYRYYSAGQLAVINVIHILQALGMTLAEISEWSKMRSPENIDRLFTSQIESVDKKINEWARSRKLLTTLQGIIRSVLNVDTNIIAVQFIQAEPIILGPLNDYSGDRSDYDALSSFYRSMRNSFPDLDLNYPVWADFYAIGYAYGGYGQTNELYKRLTAYIDENGLEICGDAYEEYPLNEVCISDENNYLIRVMITVRKKVYDNSH